ncbi:MAG: N-acetyl-gamma-glutamyl-phosphate reductase, partial [Rhodobiaceae bacterium]|nr:N-acetyl-gamma-glutamyl-phosphate reductase [Rhodobiaceae bacterium]
PLQLWALEGEVTATILRDALSEAYLGEQFVTMASEAETAKVAQIDPEGLNNTNQMKLFVFGNDETHQVRLVALLDNLGKGASGAAVQNMNLMLGLDEAAGLVAGSI